jgi:hypothetical protein
MLGYLMALGGWHQICSAEGPDARIHLAFVHRLEGQSMNFLELVMTVCTMANSNVCEDKRIILESNVSLVQCVMTAQPTMAQWAAENPEWTIIRWTCEDSLHRRRKA